VPLSRSELIDGDLFALVTLRARGKAFRFSTRDTTVANGADVSLPDRLHFVGGLDPFDFTDAIELGEDMQPAREVSLSVLFRNDDGTGWADLAAIDHDLGDATCEVSIWKSGDDWSDRRVLLDGVVLSPEYGAAFEPLTFTVTEDPTEDTGVIPLDRMVVSSSTFPTVGVGTHDPADSAADQFYPVIYGAPGIVGADEDFDILPAVPALIAEQDNTANNENDTTDWLILLAGHHVAASTVTLHNREDETEADVSIVNGADANDYPIAYSLVTGSDLVIGGGDEIYWSFKLEAAGGKKNLRRGGTLRNAVDIMLDLLGQSTIRFDGERIQSLSERLAGFNLDFYINEQSTPWEVIQDHILPLLPLAPAMGPNGLWFVHYPFDATASDAIAEINPRSRGGSRNGMVKVSSATDIANYHTISFALNAESGEYARSLSYGPRELSRNDGTTLHPLSWASFSRYGLRQGDTIETDVVYDIATAHAVLDWRIRRDGMTHQEVEYLLPQQFQHLEAGDVVTITDAEIGWSDRVAIAMSVPRRPGDGSFTFRTIPNWIRDAPT